MSDLIKKVFEISMNGLDKMDYNTIQCQLKTHTVSSPEYLAAFQKMYTRYAMKLVMMQVKIPTTSFAFIEVLASVSNVLCNIFTITFNLKDDENYTVTTEHSTLLGKKEGSSCSCSWFIGFEIPCRHITYLCSVDAVKTLPIDKFAIRWRILGDGGDVANPD